MRSSLDEIAYAVAQSFGLPWARVEATHRRWTQTFPALGQANALVLPRADMVALMQDLLPRLRDHPTTTRTLRDTICRTS